MDNLLDDKIGELISEHDFLVKYVKKSFGTQYHDLVQLLYLNEYFYKSVDNKNLALEININCIKRVLENIRSPLLYLEYDSNKSCQYYKVNNLSLYIVSFVKKNIDGRVRWLFASDCINLDVDIQVELLDEFLVLSCQYYNAFNSSRYYMIDFHIDDFEYVVFTITLSSKSVDKVRFQRLLNSFYCDETLCVTVEMSMALSRLRKMVEENNGFISIFEDENRIGFELKLKLLFEDKASLKVLSLTDSTVYADVLSFDKNFYYVIKKSLSPYSNIITKHVNATGAISTSKKLGASDDNELYVLYCDVRDGVAVSVNDTFNEFYDYVFLIDDEVDRESLNYNYGSVFDGTSVYIDLIKSVLKCSDDSDVLKENFISTRSKETVYLIDKNVIYVQRISQYLISIDCNLFELDDLIQIESALHFDWPALILVDSRFGIDFILDIMALLKSVSTISKRLLPTVVITVTSYDDYLHISRYELENVLIFFRGIELQLLFNYLI